MKAKIKAKLKEKNPGLQDALLDRVADALASTVTKEEDIETAVSNSAGLIAAFAAFHQSESDRRVTEAVTKKQTEHEAEIAKLKGGGKNKPDKDKDEPEPDEPPAWAKKLLEKVENLETTHTAKTHQEKLIAKLKEAEVPEGYYKAAIAGRQFKTDAEVETFATEVSTNFKEYAQELSNQGLSILPKPAQDKNLPGDKVPANVETYIAEKFDKPKDGASKDLGGKKL